MSEGEQHTSEVGGELRIGSYRLIERLGSGGMSSVLRGVHIDTGHEVAVKVLPRYLAKNPVLLQRFLREAKSAESLEHPNIVAIYDRGFDQGRYYLVLEFVSGGDLHERVRQQGPLPVPDAVAIIRSVAEGLRYAARQGLIHRDVKPANVLMTPEGQVKITDLGLALQVEDDDERVTRDGTTVGTVDYMAPEQARDSRATSVRSDIYSLGCTFYYLITGSPPFPGGDVVEKLKRHMTEPPPDVRLERPEVPAALAQLIQRMMAKRPENRFDDYDRLIAAIDALPPETRAGRPDPGPLYAIIDDEPADQPEPLYALIDDDDRTSAPAGPQPQAEPYGLGDLNLAALAPLEEEASVGGLLADDETPAARASRNGPKAKKPLQVFDESADQVPLLRSLEPPSVEHETFVHRPASGSLRPWILGGAAVGAVVVGLVVVISLVTSGGGSASSASSETADAELPDEANFTRVPDAAPPPITPIPRAPAVALAPTSKASPSKAAAPRSTDVALEPLPKDAPEPTYPPELETRFLPGWASGPIPDRVDGPVITVQRVPEAVDATHVPALWRALEKAGGTVEVADAGPFFEDDFRLGGKDRLIRSRRGSRAIIKVEPPTIDFVRAQPAVFTLEGSRLILDGIDLVVNVQDLPSNQTALFLCRGAELILHNCTVTIVNPTGQPFALVQTDDTATSGAGAGGSSGRFSKVRLERTLVRGESFTGFDLAGGSADVALVRSMIVTGAGTLFSLSGTSGIETAGARRVYLVRSILATTGPVFSLAASASSAASLANPMIRALGSTFAWIKAAEPASVIAVREEGSAAPREFLDWLGDHNSFAGWPTWLSANNGHSARFTNLAAARLAWAGTDGSSKETSAAYTATGNLAWQTPAELRGLAPDRAAVLVRVASPSAHLLEKTVGTFARLPIPSALPPQPPARTVNAGGPGSPAAGSLTSSVGEPVGVSAEGLNVKSRLAKGQLTGPAGGMPGAEPPPPAEPGVTDVPFDAQAPAWHGDLGRFLAQTLTGNARSVRVLAHGYGTHAMTPVRLPDGVSVQVLVDSGSYASRNPLTWEARPGTSGEALIEVHAAELRMAGVRLRRAPGSNVKHLIRVEDGHLLLTQCWLVGSGGPSAEGGGTSAPAGAGALLAFEGRAARVPSARPGDAPVCRLVDSIILAPGDGVRAEVAYGIVALENCALASGGDAIVLNPLGTPRDQFQADLWLDRCTLAAERSFVRLGPWASTSGPPDRPWLVSSRYTAFVAGFGHTRETALLRADPGAMDQGVLFWQGEGDADEVVHFTARGNAAPPPSRRPDVRQQWVELWGPNHMARVTGPTINGPKTGVRLVVEPLRPGKVTAGDLALNPAAHPGRGYLDVGADLSRIGVAVPASARSAPAGGGRGAYPFAPVGAGSPR